MDEVERLIKALKHEDSNIRGNAAEALHKIGQPAVQPLIGALKKGFWTKRTAASILGNIGTASAVDSLIYILMHEDSDVKINAAEALGNIGDPRAIEPLIQALGDHSYISEIAVEALVKFGKIASEPSIKALEDGNSDVKKEVWKVLNKIGWIPSNKNQLTAYLIAKRDWNRLKKNKTSNRTFNKIP